jgi:hypothetical protein
MRAPPVDSNEVVYFIRERPLNIKMGIMLVKDFCGA